MTAHKFLIAIAITITMTPSIAPSTTAPIASSLLVFMSAPRTPRQPSALYTAAGEVSRAAGVWGMRGNSVSVFVASTRGRSSCIHLSAIRQLLPEKSKASSVPRGTHWSLHENSACLQGLYGLRRQPSKSPRSVNAASGKPNAISLARMPSPTSWSDTSSIKCTASNRGAA